MNHKIEGKNNREVEKKKELQNIPNLEIHKNVLIWMNCMRK